MKILAVIPARGGSKGIPRKNVRLMKDNPLIYYAINNALKCTAITDVVVSTDDDEIASVSNMYKAQVIIRDPKLADDITTLDPVVYDAVLKMEEKHKKKYDIVITLQPTSPLLKSVTLKDAIEDFVKDNKDTYISVTNKPHLAWSKDKDRFYPLYEKRLNRQQLPPNYHETGAFLITKREFVTNNSRLGKTVSVYEIPENESIDIDSVSDWITCESELRKKKIVFRADGHKMLGMGHIYHCLTLAYKMIEHQVMFVSKSKYQEGIDKILQNNMPCTIMQNDDDFFDFLAEYKPDVVVNDCLDTTLEYINRLKSLVKRVVTIEDLGTGIYAADAVINALYENKNVDAHIYSGEKYICLRDEFLIQTPKEFSPEVENVLVMFGGTDPSNLTKKIYDISLIINNKHPKIKFIFIAGSAYDCEAHGVFSVEDKNITVIKDTKRVSEYIKNADIAFTSQGRTVFEFASLGVPAIVLAQNEREQLHTFAQMENGFLNLGLGINVSDDTLLKTFEWLIHTPQIRFEMQNLMLRNDLKSGVDRVKKIILGELI